MIKSQQDPVSTETTNAARGKTGDGTQEKTEAAAEQAQQKAERAAAQAKSKVREQVDQRSTALGEQVSTAAEDLKGVAEHLRSQGKDQPAKAAEQAAERVASAGSYLERSDGERILRDVEEFGRSRPWAAVAGGLLVGFAASRLLRASSSRRYSASSDGAAASRASDRTYAETAVLEAGAAPAVPAAPAGQ